MTTVLFVPLAVFPLGLQLFLVQSAVCQQSGCSVSLLCSVRHWTQLPSVECFGSCILRTWCLWVRWMQCKFPVLRALLFFACGPLFCLIWVLHPAAHSHRCAMPTLIVRPLAREAGGWCLWEKESYHREAPSGCFLCHCFHSTYRDVSCRISPENRPVLLPNVFLKVLGRNRKNVL